MKENFGKLYSVMDSFSHCVRKFLEFFCALLLFLCFLTLLFQVFYRMIIVKFVAFSFPFTEEFARYVLIWITYLISGVNIYEGSMVAINFIYDRVRLPARYILFFLTRCMSLIFVGIVLFYSLIIIGQNLNYRSSTLQAPGWLLFSAPTVGMLLIGYEVITETIGVLSGKFLPFTNRKS